MIRVLKPIVTDTYDFPTLIRRGYVYVDKTALKQIRTKGYGMPYVAGTRRIVTIGVNYDPRKAIVETASEVVNPVDEVVNEVVKSHPDLRKPEIVPLVGKSRATVERALASLISEGRIEFRGAPKNGGYHCIPRGGTR